MHRVLKNVDKLPFNCQLARVANQERKDLGGLSYLIGCEVTCFIKKDFCFINRHRCDELYYIKVDPYEIRY